MGQLGQQLQINVPAGTGQVIVTGLNQTLSFAKWTGTADGSVAKTDGWYWVNQVEIVYQDTSDNLEYKATANVPEVQQFSDWFTVTAATFELLGHPMSVVSGPPSGFVPQKPPPGPVTSGSTNEGPNPTIAHFATPAPGGQAEKPRHGKHEETPLRAEQEVKPSHGKHEEKPSHGEREEKPGHGEHKPSHRAEG